MSLRNLPFELIENICEFMDAKTLIAFSSTCHQYREYITKDENSSRLWMPQVCMDFIRPAKNMRFRHLQEDICSHTLPDRWFKIYKAMHTKLWSLEGVFLVQFDQNIGNEIICVLYTYPNQDKLELIAVKCCLNAEAAFLITKMTCEVDCVEANLKFFGEGTLILDGAAGLNTNCFYTADSPDYFVLKWLDPRKGPVSTSFRRTSLTVEQVDKACKEFTFEIPTENVDDAPVEVDYYLDIDAVFTKLDLPRYTRTLQF